MAWRLVLPTCLSTVPTQPGTSQATRVCQVGYGCDWEVGWVWGVMWRYLPASALSPLLMSL